MDRVIFLVDMNAYFASVEQAANPALRGKPIVVCGEGRTVVTTASYEARAFGVRTGMNLYEARQACPGLIPVCGDIDKYADTSLRIHQLLLEFTDQVEAFSIDECFMDVTYLCRAGQEARSIAREVKRRIRETLRLTCSIGIGPNKLVAKLASKMRKPDGLVEIRREDIPHVFAGLTLEKMQGIGIGGKLAAALHGLGIKTAQDLAAAPIDMLTTRFGVIGYHLKSMGNGEDTSPVKKYGEQDPVKSVGHSHTLPEDTRDIPIVHSYILMLSEKVGVRLREARKVGRTISLTVRYADFHTFSMQQTLKTYIGDGQDIYRTACGIFERILPLRQPVRLVGVSISSLLPDAGQGFLFEQMEKQRKLTEIVDRINHEYGEFTVKPSSLLIAENFGILPRCGMMGKSWMKKTPSK